MTNNLIEEKLYCYNCKRKTNHCYLQKEEERDIEDFFWSQTFYITKCLGCDNIAFLKEYSDESMKEYNPQNNQYEQYADRTVYPEEPLSLPDKRESDMEIRDFTSVPELIDMLYSQVVASFNLRHYLLCAIGLRMILEAICKELELTEGNLYDLHSGARRINSDGASISRATLEGKINSLYETGVIVWKQTLILHQIRDLGNATAHELEVPKRSTIRSGIEVIENVLHHIFELDKIQLST